MFCFDSVKFEMLCGDVEQTASYRRSLELRGEVMAGDKDLGVIGIS